MTLFLSCFFSLKRYKDLKMMAIYLSLSFSFLPFSSFPPNCTCLISHTYKMPCDCKFHPNQSRESRGRETVIYLSRSERFSLKIPQEALVLARALTNYCWTGFGQWERIQVIYNPGARVVTWRRAGGGRDRGREARKGVGYWNIARCKGRLWKPFPALASIWSLPIVNVYYYYHRLLQSAHSVPSCRPIAICANTTELAFPSPLDF